MKNEKIIFSRKWTEFYIVAILAILTTVIFWNGNLDIEAAHAFFHPEDPEDQWPLQNFWLWKDLYEFGDPSVVLAILVSLVLLIGGMFFKSQARSRYRAIYFLMVILLGPIFTVNIVLKDHWGRPRPREILEFNGHYEYQPPVVIGASGRKSFVCGHCSVGFMYFAFYFILTKGRGLALFGAFFYGLLIGYSRMAAGGHFVSDILWSGYVTFMISWFLYYYVFREFEYELSQNSPIPFLQKNH